jgi:type VI secretion system (T6SS) effector TldE1-like protein
MSNSRAALAARNRRKSSLKTFSHKLFGGVALACLVSGSGWTVYSKIINASAYPTLGTAGYDEPVLRPAPRLATRNAAQAVNEAFAALPDTSIAKVAAVAAITPEMFNERFAAAVADGVASNAAAAAPPTLPKLAEAAPARTSEPKIPEKAAAASRLAEAPKKDAKPVQLALAGPRAQPPAQEPQAAPDSNTPKSGMSSLRAMTERAKAAVLSITGERHSIQDKLWGKPEQQNGNLLAYASADSSFTASIGQQQDPTKGGQAPYDRTTAVYDISAKMVYLPDGTKLEAHSGLGDNLDNPRSENIRMRGVTPPHIYELKPREALFHGVPALRLNPIGGSEAIHGRDGLLAHTFMLGPNGDSNGCVSFRDYSAFLDAYRNKGIRKLAVVSRID